ncbi:SBP-like protein [Tanacetum coccineum]|uniref:SBP-like protein n=1 Tax=Tanacetum coccineum TaxID=301880 RepID=A0ABQ5DQ61_9ASTR
MPPPSTTHHRRNLSADPTPSTSIHEISTHFTNLYLNHKASTSITLTKSQSQRTRPNPHYTKEDNNDPQQETIKKAIVISKKQSMKDNIEGYPYMMSQNEEMRKLKIGYGIRRRSFGSSLEDEVSEFLVFNGVKVVAADMPPFMQVHAVDVTRKTYDSLEKFTAKTLALTLKKEFDGVYGPAWHCIVGLNFGSFVTHSVGGFLYFSMDQKLFVLLFKTNVQRAR